VNGRVGALLELGQRIPSRLHRRENIYLSRRVMGLSRGETQAPKSNRSSPSPTSERTSDEPISNIPRPWWCASASRWATTARARAAHHHEVLAVATSLQEEMHRVARALPFAGGGTSCFARTHVFTSSALRTALWIEHGKVRMRGNAFDVTREYLTYHEEKSVAAPAPAPVARGSDAKIVEIWTEDEQGTPATVFRHGASMVPPGNRLRADDRAPVILGA